MNPSPDFQPPPPEKLPGLTMRKLIRSKATKAFLTADGHWTRQLRRAGEFPDLLQSLAAIAHFDLRNVELYYLFNGRTTSEYDFTIPLR